MSIEQHDLLKSVIGQRLGDVQHMMHKVLEVIVDRAGKIHHVSRVTVGDDWQYQHFV